MTLNNHRLRNISYILYVTISLLGCVFYYILKGASGHKMVFYLNEILIYCLVLCSIVLSLTVKFSSGRKILRYVTTLTFVANFGVSCYFIVFLFQFDFADDVPVVLFLSPFILYSAITLMQVYYLLFDHFKNVSSYDGTSVK